MNSIPGRLWPYEPVYAVLAVPAVFIGLLVLLGIARTIFGFPDTGKGDLLSILLLVSLAPVALPLLDMFGRGAVLEYKGVKLTLAAEAVAAAPSVIVPTNIGVATQPVTDSGTTQILAALRAAIGCEVAVIDLEGGQAWWETRLLVLLAGSARRRRPAAIVFLATVEGVAGRLQGWGDPHELLVALLDADPVYRLCCARAEAVAGRWGLVSPQIDSIDPPAGTDSLLGTDLLPAGSKISLTAGLAANVSYIFLDPASLPLLNPLGFEQYLAGELGRQIETQKPPRSINVVRLQMLFAPVLRTQAIEENLAEPAKVEALANAGGPYVAITRNGIFQRLIARETALAGVLFALIRASQSQVANRA